MAKTIFDMIDDERQKVAEKSIAKGIGRWRSKSKFRKFNGDFYVVFSHLSRGITKAEAQKQVKKSRDRLVEWKKTISPIHTKGIKYRMVKISDNKYSVYETNQVVNKKGKRFEKQATKEKILEGKVKNASKEKKKQAKRNLDVFRYNRNVETRNGDYY